MPGKACGDDDDVGDGDDDDGDGDVGDDDDVVGDGGGDGGDDDGDVNEGDDDGAFLTHMTHNVPGMATLNDDSCDDVRLTHQQNYF